MSAVVASDLHDVGVQEKPSPLVMETHTLDLGDRKAEGVPREGGVVAIANKRLYVCYKMVSVFFWVFFTPFKSPRSFLFGPT